MKVQDYAAELADREAIRDCLLRYCRGIDRADAAMIASAYWPGALDHHTGFDGTVEEFIAWTMPLTGDIDHCIHMTGNVLIRLDGDSARVETYFWSVVAYRDKVVPRVITCGRYLDRFEKRDDEWRIAERMVVHDWFEEAPNTGDWSVGPFGMSGLETGKGSREDKSYGWLGLDQAKDAE